MKTHPSETDRHFMRRAIELSRRGYPAPNPHVGCVIVQNDKIIAEGWHEHAGGAHAEVVALAEAGKHAKGSTAYVTLEPCNHHGRTPPCAEALIAAGIKRCVIACMDPNPRAAGGAKRLSENGVEVICGVEESQAAIANEMFLAAQSSGRPFVVVKAACSLDGRIATAAGESKWITSEASRSRAHQLRAECGAVLVGKTTAQVDEPSLTARVPGVTNQPVRVVLDSNFELDPRRLPFAQNGTTLWVGSDEAVKTSEVAGVKTLGVPRSPAGLCLNSLMDKLFDEGITAVLVEGGGATICSFLEAGLCDRLELFVAPIVIGEGPSWCGPLNVQVLTEAPRFEIVSSERCEPDLHLVLRPLKR